MLAVITVKGRKLGESSLHLMGFDLEIILLLLTFHWPVNEKQIKASQMAMPNFKWAGKDNLIMSLEGEE